MVNFILRGWVLQPWVVCQSGHTDPNIYYHMWNIVLSKKNEKLNIFQSLQGIWYCKSPLALGSLSKWSNRALIYIIMSEISCKTKKKFFFFLKSWKIFEIMAKNWFLPWNLVIFETIEISVLWTHYISRLAVDLRIYSIFPGMRPQEPKFWFMP